LNRATFGYLGNRKQFGVPLATFQALQHRAADMFVAAEEISAAVNYAIEALATSPGAARSAALCAAKVTADDVRGLGAHCAEMTCSSTRPYCAWSGGTDSLHFWFAVRDGTLTLTGAADYDGE